MAGDWIKMRTDLYRDPKVCIMAEVLSQDEGSLAKFVSQNCQRDMTVTRNVTRNAIVGSLVTVWGTVRHTGKRIGNDLLIKNATIHVIDDIADLPGFGEAMESVGWVVETAEGIVFPGFYDELNSEPKSFAKTNAERQREYRERKKTEGQQTVTKRYNALHRGEERREEEKEGGRLVDSVDLPPAHPPAFASQLATAYQRRRYTVPDPQARYLPVLLREAERIIEESDNKQQAFELMLKTINESTLPKETSFAELAKSCGLKRIKPKVRESPSPYKDYTAERLAGQFST